MAPANIFPTLKFCFALEASDTETILNYDLSAFVFDLVVVSRDAPFSFMPAFICIGQELHRLPRSSFYTISCPSSFQGHNPRIPLHVGTGGLNRFECSLMSSIFVKLPFVWCKISSACMHSSSAIINYLQVHDRTAGCGRLS